MEVWYANGMDQDHGAPQGRSAEQSGAGDLEARLPFDEPVELPTEDVLDLHPFAPKDIPSVVEEYLTQCRRAGLSEVRLIHGKGTGAQRAVVRGLLANHPDVLTFADAQPQAGGWGATLVRLKAPRANEGLDKSGSLVSRSLATGLGSRLLGMTILGDAPRHG